MKIISLVDNCAQPGRDDLKTEPGLSIFIQDNGQSILFDSGVNGACQANAARLGVDLSQVSLAVLSHHHYDHAGGLGDFLEANPKAQVYLRPILTEDLHAHLFGFFKPYIGLDPSLYSRFPGRFTFVEKDTQLAPQAYLLIEIGRGHPLPPGNRHLFAHAGGRARPDDFAHEQALVLRQEGGLVVFSGCSHRGILNILDAVVARFPGQPIRAVFGGFHLIDRPLLNTMAGGRAGVAALGRQLLTYPIDRVYTGHCTGLKAYRILKEVMGERLAYFAAGDQVEI